MQQAFSDGLNYDKSTPEINARVRKFFDDVANATIVGQGFSIKFRSIHPYLPVEALESAARASFELRRVKDLLFSKEAKTQRKEGNEELKESMTSLLEFIQSVQKIYARNAYSQRKKSLNTWKFFPDYVNLAVDKGIRISSSLKNGLGLALSLASEKHPVNFRGKEFKTAEQAFEFYKGIYTISEDNNAQLGQVKLLRNILGERFKQNLPLFAEVYKKGGSEFLRKSTYNQGADFLKTTTTNIGGYIEAISNAYDDVYDEMFAAMLEAEEQGQTFEEDTTEQFVIQGVEELFNENPELASIGTPQQYSAYLDTIFPDSKVKDIVYHGGKVNKDSFKRFLNKKDYEERNPNSIIGFFFSSSKQTVASQYAQKDYDAIKNELTGDPETDAFISRSAPLKPGSISQELLNIKNPYIIQAEEWENETWVNRLGILTEEDKDQNWVSDYQWTVDAYEKAKNHLQSLGYDGLYINSDKNLYNKTNIVDYITVQKVVFEPEQIHILGNKQDIEGFKKFVKDAPKKKVKKSQNKLITSKGDANPFSEGDGIDFDNLGDVTQKGVNLRSTTTKKKSTGRKPPKSIEDEEVPAAPPNLGEDRPRQIIIPMPGNPITLTPEDLTIERLQLKFPGLNQNQLAVVAKNARKQFEGSSKERDFESKC
jgi:hypothetical protein